MNKQEILDEIARTETFLQQLYRMVQTDRPIPFMMGHVNAAKAGIATVRSALITRNNATCSIRIAD